MTADPDEAVRRLVHAEAKVGVPFGLDVHGLDAADRLEVRTTFLEVATTALRLTVAAIGRVPDANEIDVLRTAVTRFVNDALIPTIRARRTLH